MKRFAYFFIAAAIILLASGCGGEGPTQNSSVTGSLEITGKAFIGNAGTEVCFSIFDGKVPITSLDKSKIGADSSFKLIASPLSRGELKPVAGFFEYQNYEDAPHISDPNAKFQKGMVAVLYADKQVGCRLWRGSVWDTTAKTWLVYNDSYYYFDRDVDIKGKLVSSSNDTVNYDISAKAGWNIILRGYIYGELDSYVSKTENIEGIYVWIDFLLPSDSLIDATNIMNYSIHK